jgi:hypothetical protein
MAGLIDAPMKGVRRRTCAAGRSSTVAAHAQEPHPRRGRSIKLRCGGTS